MIGMLIPDPDLDFTHPGSRIQGLKRHLIPDTDPQHRKVPVHIMMGTCMVMLFFKGEAGRFESIVSVFYIPCLLSS